jgi:uncharacterized protein (DUF1697 family)
VTYVVLLRGINVSGQKKIKMAELRTLLEEEGFEAVATYIQSGNVVLKSALDADRVASGVSAAIEKHFGFAVPAVVRTADELERIVNAVPFERAALDADEKRHLVAFLSGLAPESSPDRLAPYLTHDDQLVARDRELYIHLPGGQAGSKFNNNVIEKKLELTSTMRNWKTVRVLLEMCG